jgi:hypothetical protein
MTWLASNRWLPPRLRRLWMPGAETAGAGPAHVSMNDYWVHRVRDVPGVAREGLRFRRAWPETEGTLGLWIAAHGSWHRQVSVSIWRTPDDLRRFVASPDHRRVVHDYRAAGALVTTAWTAERFDRDLIWQQALARLPTTPGSGASAPPRRHRPTPSQT